MGIYISFVGGGSMYPPDFAILFLGLITDFDLIIRVPNKSFRSHHLPATRHCLGINLHNHKLFAIFEVEKQINSKI